MFIKITINRLNLEWSPKGTSNIQVAFLCFSRVSNNSSASSLVLTRSSTVTGGGWASGVGIQTTATLLDPSLWKGKPELNRKFKSTFPRLVSARTMSWVFPPSTGFKNRFPIPRSEYSFPCFMKTLHLCRKCYCISLDSSTWATYIMRTTNEKHHTF